MRHPHPEVVERYRSAGTKIWRTDLNGSIHIISDGIRHRIRNFSPPQAKKGEAASALLASRENLAVSKFQEH